MTTNSGFATSFSVLSEHCFDGIAIWLPAPWRIAYSNHAFRRVFAPLAEPTSGLEAMNCLVAGDRDELVALMDRLSQDPGASINQESQAFQAELRGGRPLEMRLCRV